MGLGKRNVHINQALGDFALMFMQDSSSFIANKVSPVITVKKSSDSYFTFGRTNWRTSDDLRGPTSQSNRAPVPQPSKDSFKSLEHSLHDLVDWNEMNEADDPLKPKQDTTAFLMEKVLINREQFIASKVFTTTAVATSVSLTAATKWDATTTSTPIDDVDTGIDAVQKQIGIEPNTGVMGRQVWTQLKRHSQIIDLIKYVQKGVVTEDLVAALMGLDQLLVGKAVYMTTPDGIASESTDYIWGKNFLISYVTGNRPSKKVLSHSYQFSLNDGNPQVREWIEEAKQSDCVEVGMWYDHKITCSLCGYLIKDAVV